MLFLKIYNIAIIGAGEIGSRHLQALALTKNKLNVFVIDPSNKSLELSKKRYEDVPKSDNVKKIEYLNSIDEIKEFSIYICIIATTSNIRRFVIESLLERINVNFLILEKFLFQIEEDYDAISKLIKEKKVKAFVNHPRRMWKLYNYLKKRYDFRNQLQFNVYGSNWSMGSNVIHFFDIFVFFINDLDFKINIDLLDKEILESKRKNFVEFTGNLNGVTSTNNIFSMTSYQKGNSPILVSLINPEYQILIRESAGSLWIAEKDHNWEWKQYKFEVSFQSNLSQIFIDNLIENNTCNLTPFEDSIIIHLQVLRAFNRHLSNLQKKEVRFCPIT